LNSQREKLYRLWLSQTQRILEKLKREPKSKELTNSDIIFLFIKTKEDQGIHLSMDFRWPIEREKTEDIIGKMLTTLNKKEMKVINSKYFELKDRVRLNTEVSKDTDISEMSVGRALERAFKKMRKVKRYEV